MNKSQLRVWPYRIVPDEARQTLVCSACDSSATWDEWLGGYFCYDCEDEFNDNWKKAVKEAEES